MSAGHRHPPPGRHGDGQGCKTLAATAEQSDTSHHARCIIVAAVADTRRQLPPTPALDAVVREDAAYREGYELGWRTGRAVGYDEGRAA